MLNKRQEKKFSAPKIYLLSVKTFIVCPSSIFFFFCYVMVPYVSTLKLLIKKVIHNFSASHETSYHLNIKIIF